MQSLPLFHRVTDQPVIVEGAGEAADAKRRLVERAGGIVVAADHPEARLAFLAGDDAAALAPALRARGLLVNVVDQPANCDFTTPSLLDRSPVLIAIGTGGASAGLAKALRLRLEQMLPARLGALATALAAARDAMRKQWPDGAARRSAIDHALAQGGPLDLLKCDDHDAAVTVNGWLAGDGVAIKAGRFSFAISSDDPDDLTLRQARWLGQADVIRHDPSVPRAILCRARADAGQIMIGSAADRVQDAHGVIVTILRG